MATERLLLRPHPEERDQMPPAACSLSRARVSKDEGGLGLMLRDASQRGYTCGKRNACAAMLLSMRPRELDN